MKKNEQNKDSHRKKYPGILREAGNDRALEKMEQSPVFEEQLKKEWDLHSEKTADDVFRSGELLDKILVQTGIGKQGSPTVPLRRRMLRYAAILLPFLLVVSGTMYFTLIRPGSGVAQVEMTATGEALSFTLPDGSQVQLNSNSTLSYPQNFKNRSRGVSLSGEAYFDIETDTRRPFTVQANGIAIEVLGTQFNVMAYPGSDLVETTLLEGRVRITRQNPETGKEQSVILTPDHFAIFIHSEERFVMDKVNAETAISWQHGSLLFDNTLFRSVILRLEKHFGVQVILQDEQLGDKRISLQIDDESLEEILTILSKTLSVQYKQEGDSIVFSSLPDSKDIP